MKWTYQAENIKKRWQEYTEELYRKDLNDSYNNDGLITHTHLEPDILECEAKWVLGSVTRNKASGGDRIPAELFKILKDDAVKVLPSKMSADLENSEWPQDWKTSVFIQSQRRAMLKSVHTTIQLHSFHMLERLCSKSFKIGFSRM